MTNDEKVAYFSECLARIKDGPAAYCNPEVAYADALFLFAALDNANRLLVALNDAVNRG